MFTVRHIATFCFGFCFHLISGRTDSHGTAFNPLFVCFRGQTYGGYDKHLSAFYRLRRGNLIFFLWLWHNGKAKDDIHMVVVFPPFIVIYPGPPLSCMAWVGCMHRTLGVGFCSVTLRGKWTALRHSHRISGVMTVDIGLARSSDTKSMSATSKYDPYTETVCCDLYWLTAGEEIYYPLATLCRYIVIYGWYGTTSCS